MAPSLIDISAAFGLGVAAGLSTFLPVFIIALCARLGLVTLAPPFAALGSDGVLVVLGVLALIEFVADKVPVLDTLLHKLLFLVSVTAGGILFAGQAGTVSSMHPGAAIVFGLLAGGATAGTIHAARTVVRPFSRPIPVVGGLLGFIEDAFAVLLASAAVFAPWLVPIILGAVAVLAALLAYAVVKVLLRLVHYVRRWLGGLRENAPSLLDRQKPSGDGAAHAPAFSDDLPPLDVGDPFADGDDADPASAAPHPSQPSLPRATLRQPTPGVPDGRLGLFDDDLFAWDDDDSDDDGGKPDGIPPRSPSSGSPIPYHQRSSVPH